MTSINQEYIKNYLIDNKIIFPTNLPDNILNLDLSYQNIYGILDLSKFIYLKQLNCSNTKITSLDNLPNSLTILSCSNTKITNLDNLPTSLIELECYDTNITNINYIKNKYKLLTIDY